METCPNGIGRENRSQQSGANLGYSQVNIGYISIRVLSSGSEVMKIFLDLEARRMNGSKVLAK